MDVRIRAYSPADLNQLCEVWNEVVLAGNAFPQLEPLDLESAAAFYGGQSFVGVAEEDDTGAVLGLYILHPNNEGRCSHIANASYAVRASARGLKIGEKLVVHSLEKAKALDFHLLQFNAVVKTNSGAIKLYKKLGFVELGTIPGGFYMHDGRYEDILVFYKVL